MDPLPFIIYLNDVDIGINSNLSIYSDDTKMAKMVTSEED